MFDFWVLAVASGAAQRFVLRAMYVFVGVLVAYVLVTVTIPALWASALAVPLYVYLFAVLTSVRAWGRGGSGPRVTRRTHPASREVAVRR